MTKLMMTSALAALLVAPTTVAAQHANRQGNRARAQAIYGNGAPGVNNMRPARVRALQECSTLEQQWSQSAWATQQLAVYRTCMNEHGEAE